MEAFPRCRAGGIPLQNHLREKVARESCGPRGVKRLPELAGAGRNVAAEPRQEELPRTRKENPLPPTVTLGLPLLTKFNAYRLAKKDDVSSPGDLVIADGGGHLMEGDKIYWPTQSALTTRLRRLITAYQRTNKNRQIQQIQPTFSVPASVMHPLYEEATLIPKMAAKIERQQRWTRREEADFYRVVSTFGVVFDPDRGQFDWTKFRAMARLHKKTDDSLEKYLYAFMSMCRRVCRLPSKEELVDPNIFIQPITEERTSRTLYRIELLRKVWEQAL
ncbi:chromodomain-helicase-DNA-binding protein 9-like [Manis pentadactyla]|uniref:chromodomain-helicase-DNA-binding protein 9-like n=1 Tax=Manis pentadactyla TaxID=143292 RepID=UPI00255C2FCE|nr:chromodomain-helicase-DNA-binding protein 9-like [Manis pentadactyla]